MLFVCPECVPRDAEACVSAFKQAHYRNITGLSAEQIEKLLENLYDLDS